MMLFQLLLPPPHHVRLTLPQATENPLKSVIFLIFVGSFQDRDDHFEILTEINLPGLWDVFQITKNIYFKK